MTAVTVASAKAADPGLGARAGYAVSDAFAMARRNVLRIARAPDQVVFTLISPIMFTLLFRYVFGGAVTGLGDATDYATYLIPGIAVQTALFSAGTTGFALADDLQKGFVDRLRSLPMARSAVLTGRLVSDTLNNTIQVLILVGVGFAVGFRPDSAAGLVLGLLLILAFATAISMVYALIGMSVSTVEAVNAATFPIVFPLTFASSAFVPVSTMPSWLQGFAYHQPVSIVINAVRSLTLGDIPAGARQSLFDGASTASLVWQSIAWTVGLGALFGWLAVRTYKSLSS